MRHLFRYIFVSLLATFFPSIAWSQESQQTEIAHGFMNEIKSFLIEEGFYPKIEDDYINFKKEGVGFHLQFTGKGPFIYQFYVDGVQMPTSIDLTKILIDINNASSTGALIQTVYVPANEPMTLLIRVAGATRSAEDFKYVFYTYLAGLQYGYSQALAYANNPGRNYPYPKTSVGTQGLKVTNVCLMNGYTIIDFLFENPTDKDNPIWMSSKATLSGVGIPHSLDLIKAEGISTDRNSPSEVSPKGNLAFRLYFPELPENVKKFDFFEGSAVGLGTPFSIFGIEIDN